MLKNSSLKGFSNHCNNQLLCLTQPKSTTPTLNSIRKPLMISASLFPIPPSTKDKLGPKYAIIEIGGNQKIVEEGRFYSCNRLAASVGTKIKLPRVLGFKENDEFHVGKPYLEDVNVEAEILEEYRGPKIIVFKHKPKKHYKRTKGHRQELTKFIITSINKMEEE